MEMNESYFSIKFQLKQFNTEMYYGYATMPLSYLKPLKIKGLFFSNSDNKIVFQTNDKIKTPHTKSYTSARVDLQWGVSHTLTVNSTALSSKVNTPF